LTIQRGFGGDDIDVEIFLIGLGGEGRLLAATYKNGRDMNKWCVRE
jgi:endonuclease YncB( thermonuclease family)